MGLKRWLVRSRARSRTKPAVAFQHQTQDYLLDSLQSQPAKHSRNSEPQGVKPHNPPHDTSQLSEKPEEDQWDGFFEDTFPTSSELLDFPPPSPRVIRRNERSENWNDKRDQRSKGKHIEGRRESLNLIVGKEKQTLAGNTFPKRKRSKLNERTFTTMPRYSTPQSLLPSRSPSRAHRSSPSLNGKPSLYYPPLVASSSIFNNNSPYVTEPSSLYSSLEASISSPPIAKRPGWSRLSNPLPLPPGWAFQPDSARPSREPNLKLSQTPSNHDSARASRPRSRSESNKRSPCRPNRRPPSPRPASPIRGQRPTASLYPDRPHRSSSSSSSVRHKDRRGASFSSLGSIIGGDTSESNSSLNASSSSVAIDVVVVGPRSNVSHLSLASWPYLVPLSPPSSSSQLSPPLPHSYPNGPDPPSLVGQVTNSNINNPSSSSSNEEHVFVSTSTNVDSSSSYMPSGQEKSRDKAQTTITGRKSWKTLKNTFSSRRITRPPLS